MKFPNDKFADACADDPDTRCPWTRGEYFEATAQLGGPILRDRLWFFGSYGHQKDKFTRVGVNSELPGSAIDTTKDRVLGQRDLADDAEPAARRQLPPRQSPSDTGYSFNETPVDGLDAHAEGADAGLGVHGDTLGQNAAGRSLLRVLRRRDRLSVGSKSPLTQPRILNGDTGTISGGNYYWYVYDAYRTTATVKLSHHAAQFLGAEQDFHFGVQYNQAGVSGVYGYNDFIYTYLVDGKRTGTEKCARRSAMPRRSATSARSSTAASGSAIG